MKKRFQQIFAWALVIVLTFSVCDAWKNSQGDNGNAVVLASENNISTTKFTTENVEANGYVMVDTDNGLQITGARWVYALHTLESPRNGAQIENVAIRYAVTGGESAIMKFFSGDEFFYVELNAATGAGVISKTVDVEGYTILVLDFKKFAMDAGDTWLPDERAQKELTAIGLCCNNETGAPTFDYVAYNVEESTEEVRNFQFSTENVEANGYTMTDTDNGLQITGTAWKYAMYSLTEGIYGAEINSITVRYAVTGGEAAIMKFFSGSDYFYINLCQLSEDSVISQNVDDAGFTIVTLDFQKINEDAGDTWTVDERSTKSLTAIGLCCNNATGAPTFDYVACNVTSAPDEEETDPSVIKFKTTNVKANGYTMTNTGNGLEITGVAWKYAMYTLGTPINGAEIQTVTIRFKVEGFESAIMKFYSASEEFYINLSDALTDSVLARTVDADGFTTLTLDFQSFNMDDGDTWTTDERNTKDLTAIGLCCNNASGEATFDYVKFNQALEENVAETVYDSVILTVGSDASQRNLTWYSDTIVKGVVHYAKKSEMSDGAFPENYKTVEANRRVTNISGVYSHQATLAGLEENTEYVYRMSHIGVSDMYTFETGNMSDGFSFAYVADPQIGASEDIQSDTEAWAESLDFMLENFDADFMICGGDQVNTAHSEDEYAGFLDDDLASFATATSIGNHDTSSAAYSQHFYLPNTSTKYGTTTAGGNYWFVYDNTLFIGLNTNNKVSAEHETFIKEAIEANKI